MPRRHTPEDEQPSGRSVRNPASEADPLKVAPDLRLEDLPLLTGCGRFTLPGSGDLRPPVQRPNGMQAQLHPSRRGERLYYPDGRVTDLAGRPVDTPAVQRCSLPSSVDDSARRARLNGRD